MGIDKYVQVYALTELLILVSLIQQLQTLLNTAKNVLYINTS